MTKKLAYTNFNELVSSAVIPEEQVKALNNMICDRACESFYKLVAEATKSCNDPERYFIFLNKSAQVNMLIKNRKDFKFLAPHKRRFINSSIKYIMPKAEELQTRLKKLYEEKSHEETAPSLTLNSTIMTKSPSPNTIDANSDSDKSNVSLLDEVQAISQASISSASPLSNETTNSNSPTSATNVIPPIDRNTKPCETNNLIELYNFVKKNTILYTIQVDSTDRRRNAAWPGVTGLYNWGNICFMNACLQALFQTPLLTEIFTENNFLNNINISNPLGKKGRITSVFSALVDIVWSGNFITIHPYWFFRFFQVEINSMLMNGEQQDASEFYIILVAALHEDTNKAVKEVSPVQEYRGGENLQKDASDFDIKQRQLSNSPISAVLHSRTISELTCTICNTQSITFEEINIIQVELPPASQGRTSLIQCLRKSFSQIDLDGKWDCPSCNIAQPATQKRSLWKLSPVIVIHLLRFSFNGDDFIKNNIPVIFNTKELDMSTFLHSSADEKENTSYELYSITNHRGSLNGGHYTALSLHKNANNWIKYDDESLRMATDADFDPSDAYILYFKRKGT